MFKTATRMLLGLVVILGTSATTAPAQFPCPCQLPDNGSGTVTMPPACIEGYEGQLYISAGLPANNHIQIDARLFDFQNVVEVPGGNLGGTKSTFVATLRMLMQGFGAQLNGFSRMIHIPVTGEIHWAPRVNNLPNQVFAGEIFELSGTIFGDPDFDLLGFSTGTNLGLANSGSTTLTRQGGIGGPFWVDSFFDIHYQIDYVGAPGSILEGFAGPAGGELRRIALCPDGPIPTENTTWGELKALYE